MDARNTDAQEGEGKLQKFFYKGQAPQLFKGAGPVLASFQEVQQWTQFTRDLREAIRRVFSPRNPSNIPKSTTFQRVHNASEVARQKFFGSQASSAKMRQ